MSLRKYRREVEGLVKILKPGERHPDFDYPVFKNLPSKFKISFDLDLTQEEKPIVCYAGDVNRKIEFYKIKKIDSMKKIVIVKSPNGGEETFYIDAVAIIPPEFLGKHRTELLDLEDLAQDLKDQKKENKLKKRVVRLK